MIERLNATPQSDKRHTFFLTLPVDRLYMKRAAGGTGLQSVEDTVELEEASLAFHLETKEEELLREVSREQI